MKRLALFVTTVLAMLLVTAGGAEARADVTLFSSRVDYTGFSMSIFGDCGGEASYLFLSGGVLIRGTMVATPAGRALSTLTIASQGIHALGTTTGTIYQFITRTESALVLAGDAGAETGTLVGGLNVIGPGPGNNRIANLVVHFTIRPDGSEASFVVTGVDVRCV